MHTQPPAVVVGGGLAGLTATLQLSRDGVPVTLVEGSGRLGGRAGSTEREGFVRNLGPHAIAMKGPGTAVLERLGIDLPGRSPALHRTRLLIGDRLVGPLDRRTGGGLRLLTAIARLGLDARSGDPDASITAWLSRFVPDPSTRRLLAALVRLSTYADAPDDQAADVMAEALRGGGVRYLDGGWVALVDRLRSAAVTSGADIRTAASADTVRRGPGDSWHVDLRDGTSLTTGSVIVAVGGPRDVARLIDDPAATATLADWAARATPVRMACLDVALARRPAGPPLVLGVDEPLYLSVQSDRSRIAPDGGAVVQVARFLPLGGHAPDGTRAELEALLDRSLPGWRDDLVHARYLPDLVVTHDGGAAVNGGRRARPGPAIPGAPGLYVAGDWVGSRGTLSQASIASAAAAALAAKAHAADVRRTPKRTEVAAR